MATAVRRGAPLFPLAERVNEQLTAEQVHPLEEENLFVNSSLCSSSCWLPERKVAPVEAVPCTLARNKLWDAGASPGCALGSKLPALVAGGCCFPPLGAGGASAAPAESPKSSEELSQPTKSLCAGSCWQAQLPALPTQLHEQGAGGAGCGMPAAGCPGWQGERMGGGKSQRRHGERGDGTAPGAALNLMRKQRSIKPQAVGGKKPT